MACPYRTHSMQFAAFLLACGYPDPEVEGQRGRSEFVFHDEDEGAGWLKVQYDADYTIGAKSLFNAMRRLKDLIDQKFGGRPKDRR